MSHRQDEAKAQVFLRHLQGSGKPDASDLMAAEDAMLALEAVEKEIAFVREYKKKRLDEISSSIQELERMRDACRAFIHEALLAAAKPSVSFPGVGKAFVKSDERVSWKIEDEALLMKSLNERGVLQDLGESDFKLSLSKLSEYASNREAVGDSLPGLSKKVSTSTLNVRMDAKAERPSIDIDLSSDGEFV